MSDKSITAVCLYTHYVCVYMCAYVMISLCCLTCSSSATQMPVTQTDRMGLYYSKMGSTQY